MRATSKRLGRGAPSWPLASRVELQARLLGEMMERLGVDPGEAARAGGGTALAAASRRCLYCSSAEICRHWLDEAGERETPGSCSRSSGTAPPSICATSTPATRARSRPSTPTAQADARQAELAELNYPNER